MVPFAIDVMGGDNAPQAIIRGLHLFHQRCARSSFFLYGDEEKILPILSAYPELQKVCTIIHTVEFIASDTKPSQALRNFPKASMRLALEAVAEEKALAVVSAGNTGAYLALSKMVLKTMDGIDRPAIASQVPTTKGECLMLDLGGMLEASPRNLVEYALMGDMFARRVFGLQNPKVGLLNVGREDSKGTSYLQEAFKILQKEPIEFFGFVEGNDIALGTVDVVVTDGFTGNVALKTAEGMMNLIFLSLKRCFSYSLRGKIIAWLARPFFKDLKEHFDPRVYNGAIWLGLKGIAVKSHGGTDAWGFAHAVEMAYDMVEANITTVIHRAIENKNEREQSQVKPPPPAN